MLVRCKTKFAYALGREFVNSARIGAGVKSTFHSIREFMRFTSQTLSEAHEKGV